MATHLEASLQLDLDRIRTRLSAMGRLCETAVQTCLKALLERNRQLAYAVIIRDQAIDAMENEVDRLCLEFLVRHQPVASNLRFAYSGIKVNLELERVGDYCESAARQALKLMAMDVQVPGERYREIADLSLAMLREAVTAFVDRNVALAEKTIQTEDAVDQLKSKLNKDLVRLFQDQKLPFEALNPLMMITRHLERVSDQARNISQETIYVSTGKDPKHPHADLIRVLFVDEHNACRSLMAEALAQALGQPRFVFASAGLSPEPVEARTREFMRDKGFDVSRMAPKAINQVPNLDHYHVVVSLAKEVRAALPPGQHNVVVLDWSIPDPSRVEGSPAEIRAAYEQAYEFIRSQLEDLIAAIVGTIPTT